MKRVAFLFVVFSTLIACHNQSKKSNDQSSYQIQIRDEVDQGAAKSGSGVEEKILTTNSVKHTFEMRLLNSSGEPYAINTLQGGTFVEMHVLINGAYNLETEETNNISIQQKLGMDYGLSNGINQFSYEFQVSDIHDVEIQLPLYSVIGFESCIPLFVAPKTISYTNAAAMVDGKTVFYVVCNAGNGGVEEEEEVLFVEHKLKVNLKGLDGELYPLSELSAGRSVTSKFYLQGVYNSNTGQTNNQSMPAINMGDNYNTFNTYEIPFKISNIKDVNISMEQIEFIGFQNCSIQAFAEQSSMVLNYANLVGDADGMTEVDIICDSSSVAETLFAKHTLEVNLLDEQLQPISLDTLVAGQFTMTKLNLLNVYDTSNSQVSDMSLPNITLGKVESPEFASNQYSYLMYVSNLQDVKIQLETFTIAGFETCSLEGISNNAPINISHADVLADEDGKTIVNIICQLPEEEPVEPEIYEVKIKLTDSSEEFKASGASLLGRISHNSEMVVGTSEFTLQGNSDFNYSVDEGANVSIEFIQIPNGWSCHLVDPNQASFVLMAATVVEVACGQDSAMLTIEYISNLTNSPDVVIVLTGPDGVEQTHTLEDAGDKIQQTYLKLNSNYSFSVIAPSGYTCQINGNNINSLDGNLLNGDQNYSVSCAPVSCSWVNISNVKCVQFDDIPENVCAPQGTCALKYAQENNCTGEKRLKMLGCTFCDSTAQCNEFWPNPVSEFLGLE